GAGAWPGEQRVQPATRFAGVAALFPVAPGAAGDLEPGLGVAGAGAPGQGGADVVQLGVQAVQPGALFGGPELHVGLLCQGQDPVEVALAQAVLLAGFAEQAECVLADRLQQAEPRLAASVVYQDERLPDQAGQQAEHGALLDSLP